MPCKAVIIRNKSDMEAQYPISPAFLRVTPLSSVQLRGKRCLFFTSVFEIDFRAISAINCKVLLGREIGAGQGETEGLQAGYSRTIKLGKYCLQNRKKKRYN